MHERDRVWPLAHLRFEKLLHERVRHAGGRAVPALQLGAFGGRHALQLSEFRRRRRGDRAQRTLKACDHRAGGAAIQPRRIVAQIETNRGTVIAEQRDGEVRLLDPFPSAPRPRAILRQAGVEVGVVEDDD